MALNTLFIVIISASAFILSFATVWQFVVFLSSHDILRYYRSKHVGAADQEIQYQYSNSVLWAVMVDAILILFFVGEHTLMARRSTKERLNQLSLGVLARSLYVLGTCLTLQILMKYWHPLPCGTLWEIDTLHHPFWWWLFVLTHIAAWVVVYGGSVMMDLPEMLGVKQ
ncbi:nurim-like, partial [Limulus polyphemus]|uniref:Nuclear envelope membrane protein n=1 Tax=Limulus polyphemus TaxID=6850 RepID=A0ABM1C0B9_LIMPO